MNNFIVQGVEADKTKDAEYKIPAEIIVKFFHKKGALAASRMQDDINPNKELSGSKFYIVQEKTFKDIELVVSEIRLDKKFKSEEREVFKTIGVNPFLDGSYTILGEVIEGLNVVDKIVDIKTGVADKPLDDNKITIDEIKLIFISQDCCNLVISINSFNK